MTAIKIVSSFEDAIQQIKNLSENDKQLLEIIHRKTGNRFIPKSGVLLDQFVVDPKK